jgi:hypothetical protein
MAHWLARLGLDDAALGVYQRKREELRALASGMAQPSSQWQDIATAPKDGTYLTLLVLTHIRPQPMPFTGRWLHGTPGCWVIVNADLAVQRVEPMRWKPFDAPLSAAPEDTK